MITAFIVFFVLFISIIIGIVLNVWKKANSETKKGNSNRKTITVTPYEVDKTDRRIITYNFRVVGIGFSQKTKDACSIATTVNLKLENNSHDKNAVAVYNQHNERIGYIPRNQKDFLADLYSHEKYLTKITNQYHNENQYPTNYCEMDIQVQFCGDFDYFEKLLSEEPISRELYHESRELITSFKGKDISDLDKLEQIQEINKKLLAFNKTAERQNLVRIPMQETIILMNKLKLDTQLAFIEEHFELSDHTETQRKYVLNYLEKHGNKTKAE